MTAKPTRKSVPGRVEHLDKAFRLMKLTLEAYHDRRTQDGDNSPEADDLRMRFGGQKDMLDALRGPQVKTQLLSQLRAAGLKIPHCGPRTPDGSFVGIDSDADAVF